MITQDIEEKREYFIKKTIGVLMGGLSEEREISIKSGLSVKKALDERGYKAVAIDVDRDIAKRLIEEKIEVAFVALHGRYGEDGLIQGLLEMMHIPYTGSGVLTSAICMNKVAAKVFFEHHRIPTPPYRVINDGTLGEPPFDPPLIVKPASQGSTIGVSLVTDRLYYREAVREALEHDDTVIVERFMEGRELTVAILGDTIFPIVEILPKEEIYNFRAKYMKGEADFKVPALLKMEEEEEIKAIAYRAYTELGCRGGARVDVILTYDGKPYVLEVNTVPGMTETSLFPMAAASAGVGYAALVENILFDAGLKGC